MPSLLQPISSLDVVEALSDMSLLLPRAGDELNVYKQNTWSSFVRVSASTTFVTELSAVNAAYPRFISHHIQSVHHPRSLPLSPVLISLFHQAFILAWSLWVNFPRDGPVFSRNWGIGESEPVAKLCDPPPNFNFLFVNWQTQLRWKFLRQIRTSELNKNLPPHQDSSPIASTPSPKFTIRKAFDRFLASYNESGQSEESSRVSIPISPDGRIQN